MSTYIIGDIHGYLNTLEKLLLKIELKPEDHLWFAGDLINGGPNSTETIRYIKSLRNQVICILGNHDLTLLACAHNKQLLASILNNKDNKKKLNGIVPTLEAKDCQELIYWLQHRPLAHFDNNYNLLLVHAGVHPTWDTAKTILLANEVASILKSDPRELYNNLYGDQPNNWNDNLISWNRIRCIINYLTRIRFCTANGQLNLKSKGDALNPPPNHLPWYMVSNRKTATTTVVFGHWSALAGKTTHPNVIALDTGCRWGKQLTAYRIEDQKLFSVDNN